MFKIYWTELQENEAKPLFKDFTEAGLIDALQFAELLRKRRREGQDIRHVVLSSENPNSVGEQGVAAPSPSYSWKKRR
ncbi:hypothetical protein [Undibacterium sp.]|uniref:hypothetical protein n=1 Tax=Undibacterium sp. TaxID=1914977 RepID=UPI0037510B5D